MESNHRGTCAQAGYNRSSPPTSLLIHVVLRSVTPQHIENVFGCQRSRLSFEQKPLNAESPPVACASGGPREVLGFTLGLHATSGRKGKRIQRRPRQTGIPRRHRLHR